MSFTWSDEYDAPFDITAADIGPFCPHCGDLVGVDGVTFRFHTVRVRKGVMNAYRVCGFHNGNRCPVHQGESVVGVQRVNVDFAELFSEPRGR